MKPNFWDKRVNRYDRIIAKHDSKFLETIVETNNQIKTTDRLLDYGCGSGEFSIELAKRVNFIHGIDTSIEMINRANEKNDREGHPNLYFEAIDVYHSNLVNRSFSVILAFNVLHLVYNPSKVINRLNELLIPGGLLITQTPCLGNRNKLNRTLINLAQSTGIAPFINNFRDEDLENLISEIPNFDIIESKVWDRKTTTQWIVAKKKNS